MTISTATISAAKTLGAEFIEFSGVWNVHNCDLSSDRTKAFAAAKSIIERGDANVVVALVGAKGRSQHSESEVLLFKVDQLDDEKLADLSCLTNSANACALYKKDESGAVVGL